MLEVNHEHKRTNVSKLKRTRVIATIGLSLILLSGCGNTMEASAAYKEPTSSYATEQSYETSSYIEEKETKEENNTVVDIGDDYKSQIVKYLDNKTKDDDITISDLETIEFLTLEVDYCKDDLSFLNYCTNLKSLNISSDDQISVFSTVTSLPSLESLKIYSSILPFDFDDDTFPFVKNSNTLKTIYINNSDEINMDLLLSCKNLENLSIGTNFATTVDYTKFTNLKKLNILSSAPYTIAVSLSSTDIDTLKNNGVNIEFADDTIEEKVVEISNELDEMASSLNLNENSTDKEKIDAITLFVLDKLDYDKNNMSTSYFYNGGILYGALETDVSICGNYSALTQALAKRVGLNTSIMYNEEHAWNLVEVDGEYYYVDETYLDTASYYDTNEQGKYVKVPISKKIAEGYEGHIDNYMVSPNVDDHDTLHQSVNLPDELVEQYGDYELDYEYQENGNDISVKSSAGDAIQILVESALSLKVDGVKLEIDTEVMLGILLGLGLAKKARNITRENNMSKTL